MKKKVKITITWRWNMFQVGVMVTSSLTRTGRVQKALQFSCTFLCIVVPIGQPISMEPEEEKWQTK